jgi:hypothetical protein
MLILAILALFVIFMTVPIMVGARMVQAERSEFGRCFLLAIVLAVLSFGVGKFAGGFAAFLIGTAIGGFLLSAGLGTTIKRGIAISLIATGIQLVGGLVFAGALVASA